MKVYLAGPITGLDFKGCTDWRDYAKQRLAGNYCTEDSNGDGDCPVCGFDNIEFAKYRPTCYAAKTGIVGWSPMRAKEYLAVQGVLSGRPEAYDDYILSSAKGITTRDSWDVATSDLVLVNLLGATIVSIGTVLEIGMAYVQRKPIVIAMEDSNIHTHAMLNTMAGWVCPDLDYAIDVSKAILLPDGVKVAA